MVVKKNSLTLLGSNSVIDSFYGSVSSGVD
jgi:hypothetical protein